MMIIPNDERKTEVVNNQNPDPNALPKSCEACQYVILKSEDFGLCEKLVKALRLPKAGRLANCPLEAKANFRPLVEVPNA